MVSKKALTLAEEAEEAEERRPSVFGDLTIRGTV